MVVLALVGIGIAVAADDSGITGPSQNAVAAQALERIHRRNLQLESILLILERREKPTPSGGTSTRQGNVPKSEPQPVEPEPPSESSTKEPSCDPNYEGACLDPSVSDYDCEGGTGNGPDYTGEVAVVGEDHFGLDRDGDGVGCEVE